MPKRKRSAAVKLQPTTNGDVMDAPNALRASTSGEIDVKITPDKIKADPDSDSPLSDVPDDPAPPLPKGKRGIANKLSNNGKTKASNDKVDKVRSKSKSGTKRDGDDEAYDPEAEDDEIAAPEDIKAAMSRPPPKNSSRLPLPFTGRLGYACLNTYLRFANPPVFCSRTTRIASILEHRHPLADPSQPEHSTKNRPDKEKPADPARGQRFVENLCLQNIRDMNKLLLWNEKYGIKFLRLSSEAFPFASHAEYGYKLAPFAAEALAEVGALAGKLGHRLTTHPGQFTQLGSPKQNIIDSSVRDLEYHEEMLSLLKLPPQLDRDAVMILHMGGAFGDKAATLDRFRANYANLSLGIKKRLVLENDDVVWSVHELLPVCQELNIPFVLDYHHHNIIFDPDQIREGTEDIQALYPQILETWKRKGITPKMHYSEPTPAAITPKQRRKHSPRVATLPPVPDKVDLMIEAKDKEQACLELMRNFKLPGWDLFNNMIPHVREDENRPVKPPSKKATPKKKRKGSDDDKADDAGSVMSVNSIPVVAEDDLNMGGPERRVYWPPGMEEWLRPVKRVVKKKDEAEESVSMGKLTGAQTKTLMSQAKAEFALDMQKKKNKVPGEAIDGEAAIVDTESAQPVAEAAADMNAGVNGVTAKKGVTTSGRRRKKKESTPSPTEEELEEKEATVVNGNGVKRRKSGRASKVLKTYNEEDED